MLLRLFISLIVLLFAKPGTAEPLRIVFASGPDETGTVGRLVETFNAAHTSDVQVEWRVMSRDNDTHRRELIDLLESQGRGAHVVAADVVWTPELAKKRLVDDLTRRFYTDFTVDDFLEPALESATHRLRIWGVPWYVDTGVLYYRKDLLRKSGFDAPPRTWSELETMAKKVMAESGTKQGFVFQAAAYEGGFANALEFIWSAGGRVLTGRLFATGAFGQRAIETSVLTVDSPEAAAGLDAARRLVERGVSPAAVTEFREAQSLATFLRGDAVFLRSWPYVEGRLEGSGLDAASVGVAPIPALSPDGVGYGCLGGWNLMIHAKATSAERDAAWAFIRFLTDERLQKRQALEAGLLPARPSVYADEEVAKARPVLRLGRELLAERTRVRPSTTVHAEVSERVASVFRLVLAGEMTGEAAAARIDEELRVLLHRYR